MHPATAFCIGMIGLATAVSPLPAQADPQSDFKAHYRALQQAMDSREEKAIKAVLAPDFRSVDTDGNSYDADGMIAELAQTPVDPSRKRETSLESVTVAGDNADVVQLYGTTLKRKGQDGIEHAIEIRARSNDRWTRSGTGLWLLERTETQEITVLRDGVEVRHQVRQ